MLNVQTRGNSDKPTLMYENRQEEEVGLHAARGIVPRVSPG